MAAATETESRRSRREAEKERGISWINASDRVLIFDTSCATAEQSPGISLNASEKLEMPATCRLGVEYRGRLPDRRPGIRGVQGIARQVEAG